MQTHRHILQTQLLPMPGGFLGCSTAMMHLGITQIESEKAVWLVSVRCHFKSPGSLRHHCVASFTSRNKFVDVTSVSSLFVLFSRSHALSGRGHGRACSPRLMAHHAPSTNCALFRIVTDTFLLSVLNAHVKLPDLLLDEFFLGCQDLTVFSKTCDPLVNGDFAAFLSCLHKAIEVNNRAPGSSFAVDPQVIPGRLLGWSSVPHRRGIQR